MTPYTKKSIISIVIIIILAILFYVGTRTAQAPVVAEQNNIPSTPQTPLTPTVEQTLGKNEYKVVAVVTDSKAGYTNVTLSTSPRIFKVLQENPNYTQYVTLLETAKKNNQTVYVGTQSEQPNTIETVVFVPEQVTFTGIIESYDTGCFFDATCSVTIDGKKVILVTGGRMVPTESSGQLLGTPSIGDLEKNIGKTAKVYAKKIDDKNYTVYGDAGYFVIVQ